MQENVLITGCSSGFGRRMVTKFLEDGWIVYATMRQAAKRRSLFADELNRYGDRLVLMELDVTSSADRRTVTERIWDEGNGLNCLINNAGYMLLGAVEEVSENQIRRQFEVNLFGPLLLTQETLPLLRAKGGIVINVSSVFGFTTWPLTSIYCATKYALEGLTESMRQELKHHGVRVALLEPGSHPNTALGKNLEWGERSFMPGSVYESENIGYRDFRAKMHQRSEGSLDDVAVAALSIAKDNSPPLRVQVGRGMSSVYRLTQWFPRWFGHDFMRWAAVLAFRRAARG